MSHADPEVDLDAQAMQLVERGGWTRLSRFVLLKISGGDATSWLNNFCTADIRPIESGAGTEAFVLDVKGKTIAHVLLLVRDADIWLLAVGQPDGSLTDHFNRYIIREDVHISDMTHNASLWFVGGTAAQNQWFPHEAAADLLSHRCVDEHVLVVKTAICSKADTLLVDWQSAGDFPAAIFEEGVSISEFSWEAFDLARIRNRMPLNGAEVTTAHLPQEFRRDELAISFKKGCYLGQETVARIDALGHVNYFLVQLQISGSQPLGDAALLADDKQVGRITSAAWLAPSQGTIALGFVRRQWAEPGTQLVCHQAIATVINSSSVETR